MAVCDFRIALAKSRTVNSDHWWKSTKPTGRFLLKEFWDKNESDQFQSHHDAVSSAAEYLAVREFRRTFGSGSAKAKPNIVVFVADDMGWGDSATFGNELIRTPNMDRLASQGVKFTQCYSACGVCSPSRSSILTGRTPYRNGVWRHLSGNHPAHLRDSEITYPELLLKASRLRNMPRRQVASAF